MSRPAFELPLGALDVSRDGPRWRAIYRAFRAAILAGDIPAGSRVPSTRTLARQLGVARNPVLAAFDQLIVEGFVESHRGAGTFVAARLPLPPPRRDPNRDRAPRSRPSTPPTQAPWRPDVARILGARGDVVPFAPGIPDLASFPVDIWARLARRCFRQATIPDLSYGPPGGLKELREAIAAHLRATRAVKCDWRQVLVVPGVHHALVLAASALLSRGDEVWMEDPGYGGAWNAFALCGAKLVGVPIDGEGLNVAEARRRAPNARGAYVTPSHQYPLGATMTLARRLELLESADERGQWVFEDDYDSEFRHAGPPLAALQGIDRSGRVVYVGTFSKVLAPALRLAYLVAPPSIVDAIGAFQLRDDRLTPTVDQRVLAAFFADGHFSRHVHRMRQIYKERTEALVDALRAELAGALTVSAPSAGLHVVAWLEGERSDSAVAARAKELGVDVRPLHGFVRQVRLPPGLVLGAAAYSPRRIRKAVQALARAFDL